MSCKNKIRTIICKHCGKEHTARIPEKQKFCSELCKNTHPSREKSGSLILCETCNKEIYKPISLIRKHNFCSANCHNIYQSRNKLTFVCKMCNKEFKWSLSRIKANNPIPCRNSDTEHMQRTSLLGNTANLNKVGLNKLEIKGSEILNELGIEHQTQVPMFNKFTVDVLIKNKKVIIQWDGVYWHTKDNRLKLDLSQDKYLTKCGYTILRITDEQIKNNIEEVYANIKRAVF